jgi:hypothetical protein
MMIIQDEYGMKEEEEEEEESIMIGDNNSTDLSITNNKIINNELSKSANRRKQVKPNR